jgi:hypothetical protein
MGSLCQILREPQDPPAHGLSLHCPCACAAETRSAHPRSCSFRIRRAITAAFVSPLLLLTRHATLPPPPLRRPWSTCIRAMPSVVLSSTASDQCIAHQLGRDLSSSSWKLSCAARRRFARRATAPSLPAAGHALVSASPYHICTCPSHAHR